jgi:hypothetical protein
MVIIGTQIGEKKRQQQSVRGKRKRGANNPLATLVKRQKEEDDARLLEEDVDIKKICIIITYNILIIKNLKIE